MLFATSVIVGLSLACWAVIFAAIGLLANLPGLLHVAAILGLTVVGFVPLAALGLRRGATRDELDAGQGVPAHERPAHGRGDPSWHAHPADGVLTGIR